MISIAIICALLFALVLGIRTLLRRVFSVLDNIPGPPRKSLLTGNLTQYYDPDGWTFQRELEENYGQVVKLHGLFGDRQLYVFDPVALHSILVKDQDLYEEMPDHMSMNSLLFGTSIGSTIRDEHRRFRKIMIPAFSTASLRPMVPMFFEVAEKARDGLIAPSVRAGPQTVDLLPVLGRLSLELIGRTGIGSSLDSMEPGGAPTNRYAQALRELYPTAYKLSLFKPFLPLIVKMPFPSFRRFMINLIPLTALHRLRELVDITDAEATQLVADRKAAIQSGELYAKEDAKDIMSLLIKSNTSSEDAMHLTDEELVASTSIIMFAATDTTSSALNRLFHILALHPEVQDKLRAEILAAPEHLDHDALVALPYLDSFVREVLRLFSPVTPGAFRQAYEDTVLPLSTPIVGVDGTPMEAIRVPKGTPIYIAIAAVNHSKQIWGPDALEFKPERWTRGKAEGATTKTCGIYGNTMTFIGGGRSCIGFKFSQLEMKAVLCVFLRAFTFSAPDEGIKWRMIGMLQAPSVDGRSQLPIRVERRKV
ncbi:cytochrome P450 [Mycena rosella]|uniref:Cytochrome P450 n=1 Tax=Mycena rosella TaxID=1033263 RepID=A0AAD7DK07_MYCRO|nr:cytochrome P450 [Mycena rosella]